MRTAAIVVAAAVALGIGVVVVDAVRAETCADVFGSADTSLAPAQDRLATRDLAPTDEGGVGELRWVLSTIGADTRSAVVDVGRWTAYLDRDEISRIDDDGSVRWTRAVPRSRWVHLDDTHLGLLAFVDGTFRLALVDGQGALVRCDELFEINANVSADGSGGYLTAGSVSEERDSAGLVRRLEGDGTERWRAELSEPTGDTIAEVFVGSGVAVVGQTDDRLDTVITVLDDATGEVRWELPRTDDVGRVRSILGVADDLLYAVVNDGLGENTRLLTLDVATGATRWEVGTAASPLRDGRLRSDGDLLVIEAPTLARAIDPDTGEIVWTTSTGALTLGGSDAGRPISVDDLLVAVGRDGLLVDLRDGTSAQLFETSQFVSVDSVAVSDGLLLTDVAIFVDDGDDVITFVAAWDFEPDDAMLTDPEDT
ncbi:MAG: PQQ-binding-like beta-propeller repeat protein [Actinomycetota bacterium]